MQSRKPKRGRTLQYESPDWQPLLDFAHEHIEDFMWMHEVELDDGIRLHAYKHRWTRRYLHLDREGRAFTYREDGRYEEVGLRRLLGIVLPAPEPTRFVNIVPQYVCFEFTRLAWARSATRHRVARHRSLYVIHRCGLVFRQMPPPGARNTDPRIIFLGDDQVGSALEVIAVELQDGSLLVIHAMALRDHHRGRYEEAKQWRK